MTKVYSDEWLSIYGGDASEVMRTLDAASVHCVVTSPPYWGLRDYGTATWVGGLEDCDHRSPTMREGRNEDRPKLAGSEATNGAQLLLAARTGCGKCGATRQDSQLGLEATPEEYVANLVAVFREVKRVLRDDGTVWLNLGDSYAANGVSGLAVKGESSTLVGSANGAHTAQRKEVPLGLKPKDLVGIPWRVAFALQADGWYLRSDIIWAKPNPMPESVTDRPTKAHEYLFLLSKSARYYFDQEAVREVSDAIGPSWVERKAAGEVMRHGLDGAAANGSGGYGAAAGGRNLRSVWTIATRPYPGAHFAVFPPELPERCIKAGCPEGGVVLDPFAGSGTTGMVANRLSRRAILIDLNPEYLAQQMKRNAQVPVGL